jgi:tetratricopeptide (TPR) repeat protein
MDCKSMVTQGLDPRAASADRIVGDITTALRASNYEEAARLADSVLALGMHHPVVYNARALAHQQKGQYREALVEYSRARSLAPNDPHLLVAIGVCFTLVGSPAEALQAFDGAIALDKKSAQPHYRKGWTLEMLGEHDKARTEYETAIALDANHAEALGSLAALRAVAGSLDEAQALAERALALVPNQATASVALGTVALAKKDFAGAETRFRTALNDDQITIRARAVVHGLLADALDGQGRAAEAFEAYRFEKNEIRKLYAQTYTNQARPREFADRISDFLRLSASGSWKSDAAPKSAPARAHVFLVGFPQSMNPQIGAALAAHPQIGLLERDVLSDLSEIYLTSDTGLQRLSLLSEAEVEAARDTYWKRVREAGLQVEDRVVVDSQPLNALKLPLIAKLFPDAKVVVLLRDPRDVVLSCYRGHFAVNTLNFEFLTLEGAAEFYEAVMRIVTAGREKLTLNEHVVRFEDGDASFADLCGFIGVEKAPVAATSLRPLQSESALGWRGYRDSLRFVVPQLRSWAETFGYPLD